MARQRLQTLESDLQISPIVEACVLKSGREPGAEALLALPALLVGLFLGYGLIAIVLAIAAAVTLSMRSHSVTAIATDQDLILFRNSRVNVRKPVVHSVNSAVPLSHVSIRVLKQSGGSIQVLLNGVKYWATLRDADELRRLVRIVGNAQ